MSPPHQAADGDWLLEGGVSCAPTTLYVPPWTIYREVGITAYPADEGVTLAKLHRAADGPRLSGFVYSDAGSPLL